MFCMRGQILVLLPLLCSAPMEAVRGLGRWSNEHAVKSYAYCPPQDSIIPKAGFPDPQMYQLHRDVEVSWVDCAGQALCLICRRLRCWPWFHL